MKTYLINLDRAGDRLEAMEHLLGVASIEFERVSAVDGRAIAFPTPDFDENAYRRLHGRRINPAEVGCYLSHIECARRFLATSAEFALILEDDLLFEPDLVEVLEKALCERSAWDLLRLATVSTGRRHSFRKLTASRGLAVALTREKGSGAYVINRRAAQWMLSALTPMKLPYDLAYDMEFLSGLRAVFVSPPPISQRNGSPSQIQPKGQGPRFYHLSRWHYATVLPFRAFVEVMRFAKRSSLLIRQLSAGSKNDLSSSSTT